MARKTDKQLSDIEKAAIETIDSLRAAHFRGLREGNIGERAEFLRELLTYRHGSVKLRLEVVCPALGCTLRSMEREFLTRYRETMRGFQENLRIEYAKEQMRLDPNVKLTALALELGYDRETEFRRFFRRKTGNSPTEFTTILRQRLP
jgi:AraC-like DNA-binding protein